jgi:hypothetical protein
MGIRKKWQLIHVYRYPVRAVVMFGRKNPAHILSVRFESDGGIGIQHDHRDWGPKPRVREHIISIASQALAYEALTGSAEGFPEQELL